MSSPGFTVRTRSLIGGIAFVFSRRHPAMRMPGQWRHRPTGSHGDRSFLPPLQGQGEGRERAVCPLVERHGRNFGTMTYSQDAAERYGRNDDERNGVRPLEWAVIMQRD